MKRNIVQPNSTVQGENITTTHPAFAYISANRVSGTTSLYGSDFLHHSYIMVRIGKSEVNRNLSTDWYSNHGKEYIEVAMSESQWGAFVSSFGHGNGTPCTLNYLLGKRIDELPDPTNKTDIFRDEVEKDLDEVIEAIEDGLKKMDTLGLSKAKLAIAKDALGKVRSKLTSSIPFVANQFEEHVERVIAKAKMEIHGYMTANLPAMSSNGESPLQLPAAFSEVQSDTKNDGNSDAVGPN